ncbi:MAG: hypothetical protein ACOX6T_23750 [Myxococcales bacterium]|jgi:hypothetical protein
MRASTLAAAAATLPLFLAACFEPVRAYQPTDAVAPRDGGTGLGPADASGERPDSGLPARDAGLLDSGCDILATCEAAGAECGRIEDGCGGWLECGACGANLVCGGAGRPNVCAEPRVCSADGWCWEAPRPQGLPVEALWAFSDDVVWALAGPRVLRHDGRSWSAPELPTTATLRAIWASAPDDVWVAGDSGTLLHWDGERWARFPNPLWRGEARIVSVWGSGPSDIWAAAVGEGAALLRWDGRRWVDAKLNDPSAPTGRVVWATGPADVWLAGEGGALHHFDDAGWRRVPNPMDGGLHNINAFWGAAPDDVWAVGDAGAIIHWNGEAWEDRSVAQELDLTGIWGSGPGQVRVVGRAAASGALLALDAAEWTSIELPAGLWSLGGHGSTIWIGGARGAVWRFAGATASRLDTSPEVGFNDLWWSGNQPYGLAVGRDGLLARWDGVAWHRIEEDPTSGVELFAVWGFGPDDAWIVGGIGEGAVFHADGAGLARSASIEGGLRTVWGIDADDVWAAGSAPDFLHWDGAAWHRVPRPAASCNTITSLWGAASDDVWAVGECGLVLHWDGTAWSERLGVTDGTLLEVAGSAWDDVWAVGTHALFRFDGSTWSAQARPEWIEPLRGLAVSAQGEVRVGGRGGLARRGKDGSWTPEGAGLGEVTISRLRAHGAELRAVVGDAAGIVGRR